MLIEKRLRGRPRGSGKDDSRELRQIADLLISDPSLKPTTAMKRVLRSRRDWTASDETLIRRWQIKFKASENALMAAARERSTPIAQNVTQSIDFVVLLQTFQKQQGQIRELADALHSSPLFRALREVQDSPLMKALREVETSPLTRILREVQSSPWLNTLREIQNSPWMKAVKEAQNSPFARAAAEARKGAFPLRSSPR